ncbi:MAG: hypothetical protein POG24_11375 [Acidocella sp.]|nr:hypothetical protein [Acidocella sp.]
MSADFLKTEAELRAEVIDRLIKASLREGGSAREATLETWRKLSAQSLLDSNLGGKA